MMTSLLVVFAPLLLLFCIFVIPLLYLAKRQKNNIKLDANEDVDEDENTLENEDENTFENEDENTLENEHENTLENVNANMSLPIVVKKIGKKKAEKLARKQEKRAYANYLAQEQTRRHQQERQEDLERAREEAKQAPLIAAERLEIARKKAERLAISQKSMQIQTNLKAMQKSVTEKLLSFHGKKMESLETNFNLENPMTLETLTFAVCSSDSSANLKMNQLYCIINDFMKNTSDFTMFINRKADVFFVSPKKLDLKLDLHNSFIDYCLDK